MSAKTPEDVARVGTSYTGQYLKRLLKRRAGKIATPKKAAEAAE